jgi:putative sterol carrier protein
MPEIYTAQWYEALKEMINRNPEVEKNAPRGCYRVLAEIKGDSQSRYLPVNESKTFLVRFEEGKCTEYRQIKDPPPRKGFDFIFELPASVFEQVAAGVIDLIEAGLKGMIKITGDMRILMRHAELVNAIYHVYTREVPTEWPKGKPPYVGA